MLDTGDALVGGGLLGDETQGAAVLAGMNQMGYDAMALGPKELALGQEILAQRIEEAELSVLSANAVLRETGALVAEPFTLLPVNGHQVAILGLTRDDPTISPEFEILDPRAALAEYLPVAAAEADIVIVLTNIGYERAQDLLASADGVDLLVAALPSQVPDQALRDPRTGMLAVVADLAAPRHSGRRVGRLMVSVTGDGSLRDEAWVSVPMDGLVPDDPEMASLLSRYLQP